MKTLALVLAAAALSAAPLSEADRSKAIELLEKTQADLLGKLDLLTTAQWTYKPDPTRWSIAECVEHIVVTERRFLETARKTLDTPAEPEKYQSDKDDSLYQAMQDRSQKATAPAEVAPSGRTEFGTTTSGLQAFRTTRAATIGFVRETKGDLRAHGARHPGFGDIDGYQWVLLAAGHGARHTKQIEEVLAAPKFPR